MPRQFGEIWRKPRHVFRNRQNLPKRQSCTGRYLLSHGWSTHNRRRHPRGEPRSGLCCISSPPGLFYCADAFRRNASLRRRRASPALQSRRYVAKHRGVSQSRVSTTGKPALAVKSKISLAMFSAVGFTSSRYSGSPSFSSSRHRRIVSPQQHAVIEVVVDPLAHHALDVVEIQYHAARIELGRFDHNHRPPVVTVQMPALAVVIQQTMAVTKIDFTCDTEHRQELRARD